MIPCWLRTVDENVEFVDTCSWYHAAPAEEFQLTVGLVGTPVDPSAGEASKGAAKTPVLNVAKL